MNNAKISEVTSKPYDEMSEIDQQGIEFVILTKNG